jgi:chromosome segregation ATPase
MPDTEQIIAAVEQRGQSTAHQIAERVTRVETKIEGLEKSADVIRSTLHGINGELQRTAIHEERCAASLKQIADQTKGLPDALAKLNNFSELEPKIKTLIDDANRRRGAWRAYALIGSVMVGGITALTAVLTVLVNYLHHF